MRQSPTARAYRTVGWTIALVVVLLSDAVVATAGDAPRSLRSSVSDAASVVLSDTEARRITDCARLNALTPDQVAAFLRGGGRHLNSCDKPVDGLGPEAQKKAEKEAQAAKEANEKQKIAEWEKRKQPTPEQIEAQANADKVRDALKQARAAAADAELMLKKVRETNNAASSADYVALQKQRQEVEAKQEAAASAEQSYKSANDALEYANAAKRRDEQEAQADAVRREEIATQRAEWEAQADADAKARAQMQEQLKAIKTKREQDVAQAEADRKQAELDQQLTDDKLRKQREAERQQREAERQQREREADTKQKQLSEDEEARLQRERDAKEAAAQRDAEEAEIKQREEARKARDQEIKDAAVKAKDAEAEFKRKKEEQDATKKKYDELEKKRLDEEIARAEAEAKAKADRDKADADAKQKEEDVPEEEKPKRDDEDDCPPSPVGSPPKCENGGRCFQVKGKPEAQRCSCGKGYKGDRCEHKPCPPPAKEGNMVNGKCVKWETEYFCPGCNKIWDLKTTCHEIDTKTSVKKDTPEKSCKGLKEPKNELYNRMCKFCLRGTSVKSTTKPSKPAVRGGGNNVGATGSNDLRPKDNSTASGTSHRQLASAPRYEFVSEFGANVIRPRLGTRATVDVRAQSFVYSVFEHELEDYPVQELHGLTSHECIAHCYVRMGTAGAPAENIMGLDFCTWVLWVPPFEHIGVKYQSQCRIFNSKGHPREPRPRATNPMDPPSNVMPQPQPLPGHARTGMLVFATYPRVFDIFRLPSTGLPSRTYQVGSRLENVAAYFSRRTPAAPGEGTYAIWERPVWDGCLITTRTQLEAAAFYDLKNEGHKYQAKYNSATVGPNAVVTAWSPAAMQIAWQYHFDDRTRVISVTPTRSLRYADIQPRVTFSPQMYQTAFREIMLPGPFIEAGHLVTATLTPPNWFFNFVPQHKFSNGNGCWYRTEFVAKGLMAYGCEVSFNVGNVYRDPAGGDDRSCKSNFAPMKMAIDVQVTNGGGDCTNFAQVWNRRRLVTYNRRGKELVATRFVAYVLQLASHNDYDETKDNLRGLLHFATTLPDVNECYADTGSYFDFAHLTLTTEFTLTTLVDLQTGECLASRRDTAFNNAGGLITYDVLELRAARCAAWSTGRADPDDLTTNTLNGPDQCVAIEEIGGNKVATLTSRAGNPSCLKFIYAQNPFTPRGGVPAKGTIRTSSSARFTRGYEVGALVEGLIGTIRNGRIDQCLVHTAANNFVLTRQRADCMRVEIVMQ